jgi:hypothetical protein
VLYPSWNAVRRGNDQRRCENECGRSSAGDAAVCVPCQHAEVCDAPECDFAWCWDWSR